MLVLDLARTTKRALRVVMNSTPYTYDLPEMSRPRLLAGLVGLALAYAKVSTSRAATTTCVNEQLRQESDVNPVTGKPYSSELPDCRAYELVSSGNKNDVDAMLSPLKTRTHSETDDFALVSEDGGALLWEKNFEAYSDPSNGQTDVYQATRDSSGWSQSDALAPPGSGGREAITIAAASSDLSTVLLEALQKEVNRDGGGHQLIEHAANGSYTTIASISNDQLALPLAAELSGDGSHAFFETQARLAGDSHIADRQLYEWTSAEGLRVAGVNDAGNPVSSCGAVLASNASTALGNPAVSHDGARVFFQSPDPKGDALAGNQFEHGEITESEYKLVAHACDQPVELYLRENGSKTVDISKAPSGAAECEPGLTECEATFVGASEDGAKVFFITRTHMTPEAANSEPNLYEYDVETQLLTRLSVGPPGYEDAGLAAPASRSSYELEAREGWAIVSGDGSHVYFTGRGQLVPGAGTIRSTNEANNTVNLYLYAHGAVSFIATAGPGDFPGVANRRENEQPEAPLAAPVAAVTPNGSDLVFYSDSPLTAYDNEGHGELYRYDEPNHVISCLSCSPTFAPVNGPTDPVFHTSFTAIGAAEQFGGLSTDGETVFFASTDQLLPAATNVLTAAEPGNPIYNVYEWHDGVLSLISTGASPSSDFLIGASPSGSDVFFLSDSQLVPQDGEHSYQIYEARTEGGFPAPVTPAPCASAETCRSMVATPPATVAPATVNILGPGNVATVTGSESPPPTIVKPKVESRSEKLEKALKLCKGDKVAARRKACEKLARKKYASKPVSKPKKK